MDLKPAIAIAFPLTILIKYSFFSNKKERGATKSDFLYIAVLLLISAAGFFLFLFGVAELYARHIVR